jgi:hypothetical protein
MDLVALSYSGTVEPSGFVVVMLLHQDKEALLDVWGNAGIDPTGATDKPRLTFPSGGVSAFCSEVADLNEDGKPDVVVGNRTSKTITVLINQSP